MIEETEEPPSTLPAQHTGAGPEIPAAGSFGRFQSESRSQIGMSLEQCTLSRLQEVAEIETSSFPEHIAYKTEFLADEIAAGKYYIVPDREGRVIAYFGIDHENDSLYISNIAVRREYGRMGIGTLLLDNIRRMGHERGARSISLHVSEFNTDAFRFYRSAGFAVEAFEEGFYADHDSAYLMSLHI